MHEAGFVALVFLSWWTFVSYTKLHSPEHAFYVFLFDLKPRFLLKIMEHIRNLPLWKECGRGGIDIK